jgi:GT2 family glycosyltransferase
VESLARTAYPDLELIIVDNQSRALPTLELLADLSHGGRARVIRFDRPFNYAAINNQAARGATGEVLLLLNDDVEATSTGWLQEMVRLAMQPGVGPVGAKLRYPDGTIQHGGIVTGLFGMVGHLHRGARAERPAWMGLYPRTVSATTAAAMAIRREVWDELGGLDEELAVAFNDVDLCLRAERAGYRTLYTPGAELLHRESQSRGRDDTAEKRARLERETAFLRARWGARLDDDPHYSPNLSLFSERPALAWPPRANRLWE